MTEKKDYQGPLYAPHPDLYEKRKQLGLHNNDNIIVKEDESKTPSVED